MNSCFLVLNSLWNLDIWCLISKIHERSSWGWVWLIFDDFRVLATLWLVLLTVTAALLVPVEALMVSAEALLDSADDIVYYWWFLLMVLSDHSSWLVPTDGYLLIHTVLADFFMVPTGLLYTFFFWSVLVPTSHVRLLLVREDGVINHHQFVEEITCWRHLIIIYLLL